MQCMNLQEHPDSESLEQYALGRYAHPDEDIEIHLLMCEFCQGQVTATRQFVAALRIAEDRKSRGDPTLLMCSPILHWHTVKSWQTT